MRAYYYYGEENDTIDGAEESLPGIPGGLGMVPKDAHPLAWENSVDVIFY